MVQSWQNTVVMDNGGYSIKIGSTNDVSARIIPNCIVKSKYERKRVYVGDELSECTDRSSLFFVLPFEKGYLVNWDVEQQVWERALAPYSENASCHRLALSDPNYLIPAIKDQSSEIIFEYFGFHSVLKSSAAGFASLAPSLAEARCCLIVDCGYSSSIIAPFVDEQPIQNAVIRVDVGGKALTNQLKDWISYRELNVMEETYVVNECKEDACYVTLDFEKDIQRARQRGAANNIRCEYVLPDFVNHQRGFLREPSAVPQKDQLQTLTMNHERFLLPEAMFRPSDIGVDQMGIVEAAAESIRRCPFNLRPGLAKNVVLIGGSSQFPGFRERFLRDLRVLLDDDWQVQVPAVHNPVTMAWQSARDCIENGGLEDNFVTRHDWLEGGDAATRKSLKIRETARSNPYQEFL